MTRCAEKEASRAELQKVFADLPEKELANGVKTDLPMLECMLTAASEYFKGEELQGFSKETQVSWMRDKLFQDADFYTRMVQSTPFLVSDDGTKGELRRFFKVMWAYLEETKTLCEGCGDRATDVRAELPICEACKAIDDRETTCVDVAP